MDSPLYKKNDEIDAILFLRLRVYSLPQFVDTFITKLNQVYFIKSCDFTPDNYGGWIINIVFDDSKNITYYNYDISIMNIIRDIIFELCDDNIINAYKHRFMNIAAYRMISVISSGSNSIVVKI